MFIDIIHMTTPKNLTMCSELVSNKSDDRGTR